jgi:hypothetical protein
MVGILLATNLVVGLLAICLYGLIPKDLLFDSVLEKVRNPTVEAHLQETFQLHVRDPLPSRALFVWQPHGLVSISSVLYNIGICKAEGYTPNHLVTLPMWLYMPIFGDILRRFPDPTTNSRCCLSNQSSASQLGRTWVAPAFAPVDVLSETSATHSKFDDPVIVT